MRSSIDNQVTTIVKHCKATGNTLGRLYDLVYLNLTHRCWTHVHALTIDVYLQWKQPNEAKFAPESVE